MKPKKKLCLFFLIFLFFTTSCSLPTTIETSKAMNSENNLRQRSLQLFSKKSDIILGTLSNWALLNYGNLHEKQFDVVVIGSEPEGIMAAIAAAREGQKTLLLDKHPVVGGLFTLSKLSMLDINWSLNGESLNKGLFQEFFTKINQRTSFDVEQALQVFEDMLAAEENITTVLNVKSFLPIMNNSVVETLLYEDQNGNIDKVRGKTYIDATVDADIAHLAGANFTIGQEDYRNDKKMMAVTLVFELSGVNWDKVRTYLNQDDEFYTGADEHSAWGFGKEMAQYQSLHENVRIRALNIGKQNNGHVLINAFQIVGVNGLHEQELHIARKIANEELPRITEFIRKNLVGFENAQFVGTADEFYVRETRHLDAEYKLTIDDVLENRDFADRIAFGSYPIDVQATEIAEGDIVVGNPAQYAIPFRSIVPKGFENLLVASRSAGYDSLAHGSARTVPIGMTIGQAAGVAAAYANHNGVNFQTIVNDESGNHMRNIQTKLNANGAELQPIPHYDNPIMSHWAYEGVKFLRSYAVIAAGYDNEYKMEEPLSKKEFIEYVKRIAKYSAASFPVQFPFSAVEEKITASDLVSFLGVNSLDINSLSPVTLEKVEAAVTKTEQNQVLPRGVAYMVIKEFFDRCQAPPPVSVPAMTADVRSLGSGTFT